MTAHVVEKYGRTPWDPRKKPDDVPKCFGDLRREAILATQALPDPGHMLAPSREHALTEPWARKARRAAERGEAVEPPKRTRRPMAPAHKAAISRAIRARLRAATEAAGKRPAGRPSGSGSSLRANSRPQRDGSRAISKGSRVKGRKVAGSTKAKWLHTQLSNGRLKCND